MGQIIIGDEGRIVFGQEDIFRQGDIFGQEDILKGSVKKVPISKKFLFVNGIFPNST